LPSANVTEAAISDWCANCLARMLEISVDQIAPGASFARLGLDSASAIHLIVELEDWLGIELSPDLLYEYPTIAELAHHLTADCGGRNPPA
jgi:acyl carrier protein